MRIEYLDGNDPYLPLLRLFEFSPTEIIALCQACGDLADGRLAEFAVHEQPWAIPIAECRFLWRASKKDAGVCLPDPGQPFVLAYGPEAWREVQRKLALFIDPPANSFNWLTMEGEVSVLISPDGQW